MSDQWCVEPMVCRTKGVSDQWCVGPKVCRTNGVSDQWSVTDVGNVSAVYCFRVYELAVH